MEVNGVRFPEALPVALESDTWTTPVAPATSAAIFPDEAEAPLSPQFYSLDEMRGTTELRDSAYVGVPP